MAGRAPDSAWSSFARSPLGCILVSRALTGPVPRGRVPVSRVLTGRALLAPILLASLALGCERAAPGPDECVAFAESWLRARRPATPLETDTAFDELVRRCLTEPYDRELVGCVVAGDDQERCRVDYARRAEARREERSR